jgi:site-specific DNA-methyltransferase (adenine-specific)
MGLGWQYRFQYEFILFAVKPNKGVCRIGTRRATDIWKFPRIPGGTKTIHPAEKPVDLLKMILLNITQEGEVVVDFFSGSGPVAEAAWLTKWNLTDFEIDEIWYSVSRKRMGLSVSPLKEGQLQQFPNSYFAANRV